MHDSKRETSCASYLYMSRGLKGGPEKDFFRSNDIHLSILQKSSINIHPAFIKINKKKRVRSFLQYPHIFSANGHRRILPGISGRFRCRCRRKQQIIQRAENNIQLIRIRPVIDRPPGHMRAGTGTPRQHTCSQNRRKKQKNYGLIRLILL